MGKHFVINQCKVSKLQVNVGHIYYAETLGSYLTSNRILNHGVEKKMSDPHIWKSQGGKIWLKVYWSIRWIKKKWISVTEENMNGDIDEDNSLRTYLLRNCQARVRCEWNKAEGWWLFWGRWEPVVEVEAKEAGILKISIYLEQRIAKWKPGKQATWKIAESVRNSRENNSWN